MASRFRKRFYLLCFCLAFLVGCFATTEDLEELREEMYMMAGQQVGAKFYPARNFYGGAAGDLDKITGTEDHDVGFVFKHDDATYGNAAFFYVLDVDATCGEDDTGLPPLYFQAGDGGNECWELTNIYGLSGVLPMKVVAHSGGPDTLTRDEIMNTYIYVSVAAEFELPEVGTLAEVMGTVNMVPQGSSFCVHTVGAIAISVDPHGNNSITLDGSELANGNKVTNTSTAGDIICLVACDPNGWCAPTNPNVWTDGGA